MTIPLRGRAVPAPDPVAPPPFLQQPETAQEHVRNALSLLRLVIQTKSGVVEIAGPDYYAICTRLQLAIDQLEGRVA